MRSAVCAFVEESLICSKLAVFAFDFNTGSYKIDLAFFKCFIAFALLSSSGALVFTWAYYTGTLALMIAVSSDETVFALISSSGCSRLLTADCLFVLFL